MATQTLQTSLAVRDSVAVPLSITTFDVVELRQYQAALALNNVGVALLEKQSFRDALVTLKNSLELIKGVAFMQRNKVISISSANEGDIHTPVDTVESDRPVKTPSKNTISPKDINTFLNSANDKLIRSQKSRSKNKSLETSHAESETLLFDLTIISDHDNDELYDAAHSYPMHNSGYAIRIDTTCDYYTSHLAVETALIMMNYSIAFQCVAATKTSLTAPIAVNSTVTREKLLKNALKLSEVALQLLTSEASKCNDSIFTNGEENDNSTDSSRSQSNNGLPDCLLLERIEMMLLIVIQGLMHMSFEVGSNDEGRGYYAMLGDLHITAQKKRNPNDGTDDLGSIGVCLRSVAPAA